MLRPILVNVLVIVLAATAPAVCSAPQPRLVCAEFYQSDAVVIATVTKIRYINSSDDDYHLYSFRVERKLRGDAPQALVLYDQNTSARLPFDVAIGRKYLLFIDRWRWHAKGWWSADGCGNSGPVEFRTKTVREIEGVQQTRGAGIYGEILASAIGDRNKGLDDISAVATRKDDGRAFKVKIRDDGKFEMRVPAGQYSVSVSSEAGAFSPWFLSYERSDSISLHDGACAQIEFVPSDSPEAVKPSDRK